MEQQTNAPASESLLNDLLATIGAGQGSGDNEVIEPAEGATTAGNEIIEPAGESIVLDQAAIDAAAAALEKEEFYAQQSAPEAPANEADVPKLKVKGEKKAKEPKAPKAEKPKAEKPAPKPRVTFHGNSKSTVLNDRVGGKLRDFLVLETSDAGLSSPALEAKQDALIEELDTKLAKKVAEKAIMLFKDVSAGRKVSNEVMARAFATLCRDGFLTSGDKGNMQAALNDKYSIGTSRSQSNQMFALFPFLKITVKDGKGRQVPNPESTVLATVMGLHGLTMKSE